MEHSSRAATEERLLSTSNSRPAFNGNFAVGGRSMVACWTLSLNTSDAPVRQATIWNGGIPTNLGTLGGTNSYAFGINNAGQVVGMANPIGDAGFRATVWNGTTPTALGPLGSYAFGINNAGQVAGYITTDMPHATIWNGTIPTDLGSLGGNSFAFGINNAGQVVGNSYTAENTISHAMLWSGGTMTDLGTLGGSSDAYRINDSGQAVGFSFTTGNAALLATIWDPEGTIVDLNTLLDPSGTGWTLEEATDINLIEQIVGFGLNSSGQQHAFLLTPSSVTPLPAALPLFATGLGVMGWLARRRRQSSRPLR
jgi:probable HAF family extracellular repeat protein